MENVKKGGRRERKRKVRKGKKESVGKKRRKRGSKER